MHKARPLHEIGLASYPDSVSQTSASACARHCVVMRDQQHGQPVLVGQLPQQAQHLGLHRKVEAGGRFVRHQQRGTACDDPGQRQALPLAAADLAGAASEHGGGDAEALQQRGKGAQRIGAAGQPAKVIQAVLQAASSREGLNWVLVQLLEPRPQPPHRRPVRWAAEPGDTPGHGGCQAEQGVAQSGLAGAAAAEQRGHRPLP